MESSASARSLTEILSPLASLGDRLVLQRGGDAAHWTFEGQSVVVEMRPGDAIAATFLERPAVDQVSALPVGAVYRTCTRYSLTPVGCSRMISDMLAFFSGAREPHFTFAGAQLIEA